VKVGGSLLTLPDLASRLSRLSTAVAADRLMLLVGGGEAADLVRDWDRIHGLNSEASHWLAIDSMSLTARLLAKLIPHWPLVSNRRAAFDRDASIKTVILDPRPVIEETSANDGSALPVGWDCTSDSIAAWIAARWDADSLVLAKSVDAPEAGEESLSIQTSLVDGCFESVVPPDLPVHWCNIRSNPELVELWKSALPSR
jgi:5-(aminomethyl)-3-furanmethanol phosphate kinase